jgi:putative membrane protein
MRSSLVRNRPVFFAFACLLGTGVLSAQMSGQQQQQQPGTTQPGAMNSPNGAMAMSGPSSMPSSQQDMMFAKAAGQGGNFEIKAGKLAQKQSSSTDVKAFGKMMVKDHTKLNEQMAPIATDLHMNPPTGLSDEDQAEYDKLKGLQGQQFDQEYITVMLADHKKDLAAFQQEATQGELAPEKQAAQKGESVIQMHLDKIQQIAQAHNMPASGM